MVVVVVAVAVSGVGGVGGFIEARAQNLHVASSRSVAIDCQLAELRFAINMNPSIWVLWKLGSLSGWTQSIEQPNSVGGSSSARQQLACILLD